MRLSEISAIDQTLTRGGVCILPTETVYGLAGFAQSSEAIDKIYQIKGRDFDKPLALCVRDTAMMYQYTSEIGVASVLAAEFWPGPLSLVLEADLDCRSIDRRLLGKNESGKTTISFRCPDAEWRKKISIMPLALTSANRSGGTDTHTAQDAQATIGEYVDYILQGPDCEIGMASTILAVKGNTAKVLREGSLGPQAFAHYDIDWVT